MKTASLDWPPDSICLQPDSIDVESLAIQLFARTCRTNFDAPGFCLLNVGQQIDSHQFRQLMVRLKQAMALIHKSRTGNTLVYVSASRFDQQTSTKPHIDGGPAESFLMLGYEPSDVSCELEISDYARCAFDFGITPNEFMAKHNPMFQSGNEVLRPYTTRIPCFSPTDYQIVCINNSCTPYSASESTWQGTLHTAKILTPDESKRRVINSTLIASVPVGTPDAMTENEQQEFIETTKVNRRGYDKPHLTDDV